MKFVFALIGFVLLSSFMTSPLSVKRKIDVKSSKVMWKARKVTGAHEGFVSVKSGTLEFNDKNELIGGKIEIDMNSITCTDLTGDMNGKLVGHLKSDDFFGVDKYPTSTLEIKSVKKTGKDSYEIKGEMTIKGKTNPVTFNAETSTTKGKAKLTVDRSLYDIRYGSGKFFDNLGDKMIYDNFDLEVELVLSK